MATRAEIKTNIEATRENINNTIVELSNTLHKKTDIKEQIRENPLAGIAVATVFGFVLANVTSPLGKIIFRFAIRSATAAAYGYATKKSIDLITKQIKV